ncbi:MAG: tetratricopeptide repeat protein [Burkholderiales bacterium]|jgi:predicted negative regulator of RcsB-dependent stress response
MAYDLQEQDQLDAIKAYWNKYGNLALAIVTVVLLAIAGWRAWGWYQQKQAAEASVLYDQLRDAVDKKDVAKVKQVSGPLFEKYSGTVYGSMGALIAARAYHDAGDLKGAKAPLQWAVEHAGEPEHRLLARLRLSGILLDEKAYDEGLKLVTVADAGAFAGVFADRRGDLLLALGKRDEARAAYKLALEKLDVGAAVRPLVQMKLDALGGA